MLTLTGNRNDAIIDLGTLLREKWVPIRWHKHELWACKLWTVNMQWVNPSLSPSKIRPGARSSMKLFQQIRQKNFFINAHWYFLFILYSHLLGFLLNAVNFRHPHFIARPIARFTLNTNFYVFSSYPVKHNDKKMGYLMGHSQEKSLWDYSMVLAQLRSAKIF
jgi:hypothetical protein